MNLSGYAARMKTLIGPQRDAGTLLVEERTKTTCECLELRKVTPRQSASFLFPLSTSSVCCHAVLYVKDEINFLSPRSASSVGVCREEEVHACQVGLNQPVASH